MCYGFGSQPGWRRKRQSFGRVSGIHKLEETAAELAGTVLMRLEMETVEKARNV